MPKLTLSEAIAYWENYTSTQEGTETKEQIFGRLILAAAKLLVEIHSAADSGELDGIDLVWMVKADALILGEDCKLPDNEKLRELAEQKPAPQEWFDEDLDGLFEEPGNA